MSHDDLLEITTRAAARYIANLEARDVFPSADVVARLDRLVEALPRAGTDPRTVIGLLDELASPATVATTGPRYFGFVTGGCLPAALAANWLATAWDQPSMLQTAAPMPAKLEQLALDWLIELLGLPRDCGGGFVTGATMANFCALAAARSALLRRVDWDPEADGLFGAPPVNVIVGDEVHPSVTKALGLLGLGRARVSRVAVDGQGRLRADALPPPSGPTIVCLQAGNVNTGACDPIAEVCDRLDTGAAWVHVDGAFGLWAAAAPSRAYLTAGIERADSWATDAHKWLNVPYDSGIVFVRDADALRRSMAVNADYLPAGGGRDPSDFTPELSRRARGVEVWAAIKSLGSAGVADIVETGCRQALDFARGLEAAGYRILNEVVLNQVLVSFGDAPTTERVIEQVQRDGVCWVGGTMWQGQTAMRISVSNWSTREADVERSLAAILGAASRCAA